MGFERALAENPAPKSIGDVRLRYEEHLLIGEAAPRAELRLASRLAFAGGLGAALGSLALLLAGTLGSAAALGAAAALGVTAAAYLEQRARAPRRFVFNFDAETLRLDRPVGARARSQTRVFAFDQAKDVRVVKRGPGFGLEADLAMETFLLIDRVPPDEVEELRRTWRTFRAALGLSA